MDYEISNIVANTEVGHDLDLNKLFLHFTNCQYDPEFYYAAIYKLEEPRVSILVNKSGKIIFTGIKSFTGIKKALDIFYNDLKSIGYKPRYSEIFVQNIVVTADLKCTPNLSAIVTNTDLNVEYEPEIFPALILRNIEPPFTGLIFKNGKIIITGLKEETNIKQIFEIVKNEVQKNK